MPYISSLDEPIRDPQLGSLLNEFRSLIGRLLDRSAYRGPGTSLFQFSQFVELASRRGISLANRVCIDFGCGSPRPFGVSNLLYLAGAQKVTAIDFEDIQDPGAVAGAALATVLAALTARLTDAFSPLGVTDAILRHQAFQYDCGRLLEGDMGGIPQSIRLFKGSFDEMPESDKAFDIMVSNSVFEHIAEIHSCLAQLRSTISPNGAIYTAIDYRDHRAYAQGLSGWEYFVDDGDYTPGYINKIRHSEMVEIISDAGFRVDEEILVREIPSPDLSSRFLPKYKNMPKDDIEIQEARLLLRPA